MPDGRHRRKFEMDGVSSADAVSASGCWAIRSNSAGTAIEVSYNGGAYVTLAGSGGAWSAITAPTADLALNHTTYKTEFTWDGSGANDCLLLQSANNAAGSGVVLYVKTNGSSTTKAPFRVDAKGNIALVTDVNGKVGIGVAAGAANRVTIQNINSGADETGIIQGMVQLASGNTGASISGVSWTVSDIGNTTALTTVAVQLLTLSRSSAAVDNTSLVVYMQRIDATVSAATGTIYGTWIKPTVANSKTVTNWYGVYLPAASVGGGSAITNRYSIYVEASAGKAFFGDQVLCSPTSTLAGLNVGSLAGNPSSVTSGDVWVNSSNSTFNVSMNTEVIPFEIFDPGSDKLLFWDESANKIRYLAASTGLSIVGTNMAMTLFDMHLLTDPNADRLLFWDDSAGSVQWLTLGTNLTITGTTLDAAGSSGANTALSNLASVSVNSDLFAQTGLDLGGTSHPWRNLYIYGAGTYGSHSLKFHGTPTGNRTLTFPDATDTVAVLGIAQTFSGAQTFTAATGGIIETITDTATASSSIEFFDQNITLSPASSASGRTWNLIDQTVSFGTAQTLGAIRGWNQSITHNQNAALTGYTGANLAFTKSTGNSATTAKTLIGSIIISSGTTGTAMGHDQAFEANGATITQATGQFVSMVPNASGTITTGFGFYASADNGAGGTFTNFTAFRAFSAGTITNLYGFASSVGFKHGLGTLTPGYTLDVQQTTSATNTVSTLANYDYTSSGTPAAGFGLSERYALKSSTTAAQLAAQMDVRWQDATHASRSAVYSVKTTANTATKERMLLGGYKSLTDNTATDIFNVTFSSAEQKAAGGLVIITCIAKKADTTDTHAITETVAWTIGHWNGSSNINVGLVTGSSKAVGAAGAYGLTYSTSGAGTDTLTFRVAANTTHDVVTEIYFQVIYGGDAEVTLA